MNHLLRPRIWPSFLASSGVGPCDVPSGTPRNQSRGTAGRVARWHTHLRGLATAIHEISGLPVRSDTFTLIRERPTKKRQRHFSRCLFLSSLETLYIFAVPSARLYAPNPDISLIAVATIHLPALSLANSSGLMVQNGVPSFVNRTLYS